MPEHTQTSAWKRTRRAGEAVPRDDSREKQFIADSLMTSVIVGDKPPPLEPSAEPRLNATQPGP